jgi:hypothetical protein
MPAFARHTVDGNSNQHAPEHEDPPFQLEDLPGAAVVLLADHASSPATPAACLLPLVCRGWQAVASRVQLLVDIRLDLAPGYRTEEPEAEVPWMQQLPSQSDPTAAAAQATAPPPAAAASAAAATAAAAAPAEALAVLRGTQLAAWLAKHRGSVRSLVILPVEHLMGPFIPAWEQDLAHICEALTAPQQAPSGGIALPHLVQLELPVLGLRGTSAFLRALAACTGLQQLRLERARNSNFNADGADMDALAYMVAPLTRLRVLHIEGQLQWPYPEPGALAGLLRALSPSLEDMQLMTVKCVGSIPLSCFTHLVRLRSWEWPSVQAVEDDTATATNSSSSRSSSNISTMSSAAALTALTRLLITQQLDSNDARLQLPNLQALHVWEMQHVADPAVWQQLQGMPHLQQLTLHVATCLPTPEYAGMLGGLTQLQQLQLLDLCWCESLATTDWEPWAAAVADLTRLSVLHLPAYVLLAGGSAVLAPLTPAQGADSGLHWPSLVGTLPWRVAQLVGHTAGRCGSVGDSCSAGRQGAAAVLGVAGWRGKR